MMLVVVFKIMCFLCVIVKSQNDETDFDEPPEGYYAFVESPSAVPPKVRSPPYNHVNIDCKNMLNMKSYVTINNLCGDLNKGQIPKNPLKQNVNGEPYPFELIRNQTLKFLSKTLPVLKADDTIPKVTQIMSEELIAIENKKAGNYEDRKRRELNTETNVGASRKFCDGGGMFCILYRVIQGEKPSSSIAERREEAGPVKYEGPPTPCPAKVEYATPVFAKNYQGSWRYVVQIPYEGYFTQTVEVTRCLQARCHYLDGGCLSSPRWVSLLVAEIFYPKSKEVNLSSTTTPSIQDFQAYQTYLQKRAGEALKSEKFSTLDKDLFENNTHCDGQDEIGCFQVRLYYDWFLVPGSCKCWRPDYFAKYVRRKSTSITSDL